MIVWVSSILVPARRYRRLNTRGRRSPLESQLLRSARAESTNVRPRDLCLIYKVHRCLSLLVWLLGVNAFYELSNIAGSKGHRLSCSLLWGT